MAESSAEGHRLRSAQGSAAGRQAVRVGMAGVAEDLGAVGLSLELGA